MVRGDLRPDRAVELVEGVAEQYQGFPCLRAESSRKTSTHIFQHTEHPDDRGGQDWGGAGLVVEADVAAGDRNAKRRTAVGEAPDGLAELPHHRRILG